MREEGNLWTTRHLHFKGSHHKPRWAGAATLSFHSAFTRKGNFVSTVFTRTLTAVASVISIQGKVPLTLPCGGAMGTSLSTLPTCTSTTLQVLPRTCTTWKEINCRLPWGASTCNSRDQSNPVPSFAQQHQVTSPRTSEPETSPFFLSYWVTMECT